MSMVGPSICIVDIDTKTPVADIRAAAIALNIQVNEHWFPYWGTFGAVRAATPAAPPLKGEIQVQLRKVPGANQQGALALHDEQPDGTPIAYVFPLLCAEEGESWTSAASHEILELLGDPRLNAMAMLPDGRICAVEVCDQIQSETYLINGVAVSNFNTPANFSPPSNTAGVKWDYLGTCTTWFETRPGGYSQVFVPGTGWQMITAATGLKGYRKRLQDLRLGRAHRRSVKSPRKSWWRRLLHL